MVGMILSFKVTSWMMTMTSYSSFRKLVENEPVYYNMACPNLAVIFLIINMELISESLGPHNLYLGQKLK